MSLADKGLDTIVLMGGLGSGGLIVDIQEGGG